MQNSKFIDGLKYTRHGKVIKRLKVKIKTVFSLTVKKKKNPIDYIEMEWKKVLCRLSCFNTVIEDTSYYTRSLEIYFLKFWEIELVGKYLLEVIKILQ